MNDTAAAKTNTPSYDKKRPFSDFELPDYLENSSTWLPRRRDLMKFQSMAHVYHDMKPSVAVPPVRPVAIRPKQ